MDSGHSPNKEEEGAGDNSPSELSPDKNTTDEPYDSLTDQDLLEDAVREFLAPLKQSILDANSKTDRATLVRPRGDVSVTLLQSLCHFIWDVNLIYANPAYLNRLYAQLALNFKMTSQQSDLNDQFDYKPAELVANKASQLFILLVLPKPTLFLEELANFAKILEDVRITRDVMGKSSYAFLFGVFRQLYVLLADVDEELQAIPVTAPAHDATMMTTNFDDLLTNCQFTIHGMSCIFIKLFKLKPLEKIRRMQRVVQFDTSSAEWCLALAEIMRFRRRETGCRNKWPTLEEMSYLEKAKSISPHSVFVRLAIFDTIIGNVRDSSGRFHCGEIHLETMEDSMRYLIDNCVQITVDYPNNVTVLSIISDYFARYFPHSYFDPDRSLALLNAANELNPSNPKTAHRFGILYRMSFGNCDDSLIWLARATQLDPSNYKATTEYYKTLIGKPEQYPDVAFMMETTLKETSISDGWNDYEMMDFLFLLGIAHFVKGDKEKTLEVWEKCADLGETVFTLEEVLTSTDYFRWPTKLVDVDKLKLWIQAEQSTLNKELENENPSQNLTKRKLFIDQLFAIMLGCKNPKRPAPKKFYETKFPPRFYNLFSFDS